MDHFWFKGCDLVPTFELLAKNITSIQGNSFCALEADFSSGISEVCSCDLVVDGRLDSANNANTDGVADRVVRQGGTGFQREAGRTARSGPAQTRRSLGRVPQRLPRRADRAPMPLCARI